MTTDAPPVRSSARPPARFRHEALLYAGDAEFVESTASFVRDGLDADEPVLVVVGAPKIEMLRSELGDAAAQVQFADMEAVGRNPARIIPAWRDYVTQRVGTPRIRGIGEPIWAARPPAELVESQHHEALLNLAFVDAPALWLLCPYDTDSLDPAVVDEAFRSHPLIARDGHSWKSAAYRGLEHLGARFEDRLPEPPTEPRSLEFTAGDLGSLRGFVGSEADRAGLDSEQRADFTLAVSEVAANSLRYGGGRGLLRAWHEADTLLCEIRDRGQVEAPLAGRERPGAFQVGGRGLWLANQLCDLVQIRTSSRGTTVRLHMRRLPPGRPGRGHAR